MKFKKILLLVPLLFIILVPSVFAVGSGDFLVKAQKYVNGNCSGRNISNQNSLLCYLFYKTNENSVKNAELEDKVNLLEQKVTTIEAKLSEMPPSPTPTPEPFEFTFFQGIVPISGGTSPVADGKGYTRLMYSFQCTVGEAAIFLQYSSDQQDWVTWISRDPTQCRNGEVLDLNPPARYFRVVTGSTTNPSLSVNSLGHFSYQ